MTTGDKKRRMDRSRKDACYYYVNEHRSSSGHFVNALDLRDPVPEAELRRILKGRFDARAVAPPVAPVAPVASVEETTEVPGAEEPEELAADDDFYTVPAEALAPEDPELALPPVPKPKPIPKLTPPESWKFRKPPPAAERGKLKLKPGTLVMRISNKRDGAIDNPTREDCVGPYIVKRYEGINPRRVVLHDPTHRTTVPYNVNETFYYDGPRPSGFPPAKPN